MRTPDPKFIDASDWQALPWYSSGGTRAKRVLQDEQGGLWYFKCSERKPAKGNNPEKYYKYEFWSEVISYQLGYQLGLDILRYDVALHDGELGCISPLMIDQETEQLVEVGRYMTAIHPGFNPEDRKTHGEYSFDFLIATLEHFDLADYMDYFLKTMVFDALIGNTDRHQENWAFIARSTFLADMLDIVENESQRKGFGKLPWIIRNTYGFLFNKDKNKLNQKGERVRLNIQSVVKMAPIYDNGSSLGRELNEERILKYLKDAESLNRYLENGKSELHWEKQKVSHFDIIGNLFSSSYLEQLVKAASFLEEFKEQNVSTLVLSIDKEVPEACQDFCLPDDRKKLIIKILTLRAQKIKEIITNG